MKPYSKLQQYGKTKGKEKGKGIHHPLLAIDVENDPSTGGFICAGVYGRIKRKVKGYRNEKEIEEFFDSHNSLCEFLANLKKNSCILVFFNLNYDKPFLNQIINHNTVLYNSGRIICCRLKDNNITLMDIANHVDGSLENWINYLDMENKYGVTKKSLSDLKERVMNDAKATYYLASFIEDFYYYQCAIPLKLTVSSNAFLLFRKHFLKDMWIRKHDRRGELEQEAYYGGRTECFRRGTFNIYEYDINSAYLSIMRDKIFPDMSSSHYVENGRKWRKYWDAGFQMIMRCKVRVPNCYIPILPYRISGKLCFPRGTFTGTWSSAELAEAMKQGTEILECYEFVYYRRSKPYFKDFAEFVWNKRREYKEQGNKGMDLMIKKIGNSLYGKFAQRNEVGAYYGLLSEFNGILPEEFKVINKNGDEYLIVKGKEEPSPHYFPAIAAFITSYCRLKLLEAIKQNENTVIYCDTDSVKLIEPARGIRVSKDLGDWTFEGHYNDVSFYRPKMYGQKRKGVPKRAQMVYEDEKEERYEFEKPLREKEAIRRGDTPCRWVNICKVLSKQDDKREWDETLSTPLLIEEDKLKTIKECESCGCFTYDWAIYRTIEWQYKKGGGWHGDTFVDRKPRRTAGKTIEKMYCYDCYERIRKLKEG